MITLNVNSDEVVKFTNILERINKSAMPVAVRQALNSCAFDVKKRTLQKSADRNFEKRQPNFFKANSRVEMAKGFDISEMKATIGMVSLGGTNYAVDDLEQQESGGSIKSKSFIPLDSARSGKSSKRLVQRKYRLSKIKNIVKVEQGKNFIQAVYRAGQGGNVLRNGILFRVDKLSSKLKSGKLDLKLTGIYSVHSGRSVSVKSTHFMREASLESGARIDRFYMMAANAQFKKLNFK